MEHVAIFHCSKTPFYVLKALKELVTVVRTLSEDIHQVKSDSIIINNDMMKILVYRYLFYFPTFQKEFTHAKPEKYLQCISKY